MNIINTIMTNTIKYLNKTTIKLTHLGKSVILTEIKYPKKEKVWYKINNKFYA